MKIGNIPTASQLWLPATSTGKTLLIGGLIAAGHYSLLVNDTVTGTFWTGVGLLSVATFAHQFATRKQRGGYLLNKPVKVNPDAMHANLQLTQWLRDKGLHLPAVVTEGKSHQFRILIIPNEDPASVKKLIPALSMNLGVAEDDLVWRQNFKKGKSAILVPLHRDKWDAVPFNTEHLDANGIQHFIGMSIDGQAMVLDRIVEPHALIAGSTNSGKSEVITAMIAADKLSKHNPVVCVIDPKDSLDVQADHMLTELDTSTEYLEDLAEAMKERQASYKRAGHKDFISYLRAGNTSGINARPIMIYIDEIADLVTPAPGEKKSKTKAIDHEGKSTAWMFAEILSKESKKNEPVDPSTMKRHERAALALDELARKARSAGMYLTIGIQSPKAEILNTSFRNNFGCRIAMNVADQNASRVALDQNGAETLPKFGACLFKTSLNRSPILGRAAIVK